MSIEQCLETVGIRSQSYRDFRTDFTDRKRRDFAGLAEPSRTCPENDRLADYLRDPRLAAADINPDADLDLNRAAKCEEDLFFCVSSDAIDKIYVRTHTERSRTYRRSSSMYDLATQTGRKRISQDFNHLFMGLDHKAYARKLGVSERTARRLRTGERAPHKATAQRMADESTRIRALAAKDDAEFARYIEEVRRANAEKQGKIKIERMREEGIAKTVPKWFLRAVVALDEGKFDVAAAILADRLAPEEIQAVEPALIPYALTCLGVAWQYLGHPSDAAESYRNALQAGLSAHRPPAHIAWFRTNLAGGLVRMRELEDAMMQCDAAIDDSISHLPAYYVALCASDALRDMQRLAIWIGRTIQVAKSAIPPNRLEEFLRRAADDPDLAWARNQAAWADMARDLRSIIASEGRA